MPLGLAPGKGPPAKWSGAERAECRPAGIHSGGLLRCKYRCGERGLKRSQPRRTVRRGLLRLKHRCRAVRRGASSAVDPVRGGDRAARPAARPPALLPTWQLLHSLSLPRSTTRTRWLQEAERVAPSGGVRCGGGSTTRTRLLQEAERVAPSGAVRCGGGARRFLLVTGDPFRRWHGGKPPEASWNGR